MIEDLARVTTGADYWSTHPLPDRELPAIRVADGPHGLRVQDDDNPDHLGLGRSLPATCFPPAVTLASTWDPALVERVGVALAREARAQGVHVVLGPGIEIKRSPLCGRNFEYYSEDPLLAARLAGAAVRGLQSQGVGACLKHFAANTQETDRLRVSADIDERALREIYLRVFELAIREHSPWSVMSAYNRINGVFASENHWLLTKVLRDEWGYDGVVMSDWGAVHDPVDAVAAGLDLRMPGNPADPAVAQSLAEGRLERERVERIIDRLRLLAQRTGAGNVQPEPFDRDLHHELARAAAAAGAVLLHNDDALLPLDAAATRSIAVIGELARTPRYQGAGSSAVNPTRLVTALDALRARLAVDASIAFAPGYGDAGADDAELVREAVEVAAKHDLVLLFLGLPATYEAEGRDRTTITLPAEQLALIDAVTEVHDRVVVVLSNGAAVSTAAWRDRVGAILECWLTGQAHGDAIVDVLTGEVNPSGRLAETIPVRLEDTSAFLDFPGEAGHVRHSEGIFVGYRWFDARDLDVDYPFGHGLSHTTFAIEDLDVTVHPLDAATAFTASVTVTNTGDRTGAEVVQVYVGDRSGVLQMPLRELRAFAKVALRPGESRRVDLEIARTELEHFHPQAGWTFTGGSMEIAVGASSRDIRVAAVVEVPGRALEVPLTVWSTFGEWFAHPVAGPQLQRLIDERGGLKGRIADLLGSDVSRDSVLGGPFATFAQFPGVPFDNADAERILATLESSPQ